MVCVLRSIYAVHDEAKDKAFELEMSWICDESNREHQRVSKTLQCLARSLECQKKLKC